MKSTDAPSKQAVPFGTNGPREAITPTTPSGSNQASYDQGFPPITMTLKSAGGLPPKGQDMNQILFEQSSFNRYFSAGGGYVYDSTFSTAVGGYPLSARIPNSTGTGFWFNTVEDNQANPENSTAALSGWVPIGSYGVTSITGLSSASVTLTTLQASKDRVNLSGNLTANINIVVPAWVKYWQIYNGCSGSFSLTVKTPSGSGVVIPQGYTYFVFCDGVNVSQSISDQYAKLNGDATKQFSALDATSTGNVVNLGQMNTGLALKANLAGSSTQGFAVAGGTSSNSAVAYNQFQSGSNGNGAYIKLPNGGQWCRTNFTVPAGSSSLWTFPLSFPSAPAVFVTNINGDQALWPTGVSASGSSIYNSLSQTANVNLLAIY